MRVAITGGTGLVGRRLAEELTNEGHEAVVISRHPDVVTFDAPTELVERVAASVTDREALITAFEECEAVAHLAGINREVGDQTFDTVHIRGTRTVVDAAEKADVSRVALTSFLRARPGTTSGYLDSKWRSEELVRDAALEGIVLKPGVVYGEGDQMVTHIARSLATIPLFGSISLQETHLRPLAVEDLTSVIAAALTEGRLTDKTVPVLGPETLTLAEAVRRIGTAVGRDPFIFPLPTHLHYALAAIQEWTMKTPIITRAQVRMLTEDLVDPVPERVCSSLPADLEPEQAFTKERIEEALGADVSRYGLTDLALL